MSRAAPRVELCPIPKLGGALAVLRDVPSNELVRECGLERRVAIGPAVVVARLRHDCRARLAAVVTTLREP